MMRNRTKKLCQNGLFIALVTAATMVVQIPMPATDGYIHLGDSIILIISVFWGWQSGLIAGGLGSMFADILSGHSQWAIFSLLIKGAMGMVAGRLGSPHHFMLSKKSLIGAIFAETLMVGGYFLTGALLSGSFSAALAVVPGDIMQGIGGFVIFATAGYAIQKVDFRGYFNS